MMMLNLDVGYIFVFLQISTRLQNIILIKVKPMQDLFADDVDMFFTKNDNFPENQRKQSCSYQKSNENLRTHKTKQTSCEPNKSSIKGKYIDKLKEYTKNNEELSSINEPNQCSLRSLSKRERNRISAKQSRDRKKLYIELMEYEQKKLEIELEEVAKEVDETKTKIFKFCSTNKTTVGFATLSQLEAKLQRILSSEVSPSTDEQISIVLDSISFRIGATGRERIQKQNECYKQIVNLSLPALHRYLIWAATQNKHIFQNENTASVEYDEFGCPLLLDILDLDTKQSQLTSVKAEITSRKKQLIGLIEKFWETKGNIETSIKTLESEMDVVREILSPSQAAKFMLFASHNKYRKDLNFFEEDLNCKEDNDIDQMSKPSKRHKKEPKNRNIVNPDESA